MYISKSLFKEYVYHPKLAWRHKNDKATYKKINESMYGQMDAIAIGQEVEDAAKMLRPDKEIMEPDTRKLNFSQRHKSYDKLSRDVLNKQPNILYQPSFVHQNLFVKGDFLVKNEIGTYDLYEVKSKSRIRKKSKELPLIDDISADVSFQKYVLEKTLGLLFSGNCFVVHINADYIHNGEINYNEVLVIDDVTGDLMTDKEIKPIIEEMEKTLRLTHEEFNQQRPYSGENTMIYFGQKQPKGSIFTIPRITQAGERLAHLYHQGKHTINELTKEDIHLLTKGKEDSSYNKYITLHKQGTTINHESIQSTFDDLSFPLYFYDYETVSSPIPHFHKSKPRQHIVVQYSLHKLNKDGSIVHTEGIIEQPSKENEALIQKMLDELTDEETGTYVVRYKGFENNRNKEMMEMYPHHADRLTRINENTFDLMDVFKNYDYFDPAFLGSCSIKKVLPVLTDISYDNLEVGNGALASQLLDKLVKGKIDNDKREKIIKDLLVYCKQDTRAMVAIYQKLLEAIS